MSDANPSSGSPDSSAYELLDNARRLLQDRKYPEAMALLKRAAQSGPQGSCTHCEAVRLAASIQNELGNPVKAARLRAKLETDTAQQQGTQAAMKRAAAGGPLRGEPHQPAPANPRSPTIANAPLPSRRNLVVAIVVVGSLAGIAAIGALVARRARSTEAVSSNQQSNSSADDRLLEPEESRRQVETVQMFKKQHDTQEPNLTEASELYDPVYRPTFQAVQREVAEHGTDSQRPSEGSRAYYEGHANGHVAERRSAFARKLAHPNPDEEL